MHIHEPVAGGFEISIKNSDYIATSLWCCPINSAKLTKRNKTFWKKWITTRAGNKRQCGQSSQNVVQETMRTNLAECCARNKTQQEQKKNFHLVSEEFLENPLYFYIFFFKTPTVVNFFLVHMVHFTTKLLFLIKTSARGVWHPLKVTFQTRTNNCKIRIKQFQKLHLWPSAKSIFKFFSSP